MSVGFGFSFGDFVTGISLIIDLVQALDDAKGARAEIRMLQTELNVLQSALEAIKQCNLQKTDPYFDTAMKAVADSLEAIGKFRNKVTKYIDLDEAQSVRRTWRKVKWALVRREDVDELRARLGPQVTALNLLLSAIHLSRSAVADTKSTAQLMEQNKIIAEIHTHLERSDVEYTQLLERIESLVPSVVPPPHPNPAPTFEVRPLRLIGAPVIAMDHFIERPKLITSIELAFSSFSDTVQKIIVLQGMGGIGKSQLARSYAYTHQQSYTSIFWLNAKTEKSLSLGIAQLAEQIPLPDVLDSNRQVRKDEAGMAAASNAVTAWLSHQDNKEWLLVLDNVDNQTAEDSQDIDEVQSVAKSKDFDAYRYIPQVSHGSLLITSRLSFLSRAFGAKSVQVGEMSEDEAIRLLSKASQTDLDEAGVYQLVHRLGSHPLALSQAGRYIQETHTSPLAYLNQYHKRFRALIKKRPGTKEYHNGSITATLSLSYDKLMERNPSAAALLMLCSCLDNSNISFELFGALIKAKEASRIAHDDPPFSPYYHWIPGLPEEWLSELCDDEDLYLEAITSLHHLSFVRHNETLNGVSIHPLIHEWSLQYYDTPSKEENLAAACNILGAAVPQTEPYFEGLPIPRIQNHIDRWFSLMPKDIKLRRASIGTILAMSEYDIVRGPLERAYQLRQVAYDNAKSRFGIDHRCTAEAGIAIAMTHFQTEEYAEAIKWYEAHRDSYSKIDWPQSGFGHKENESMANLVITSHLILCYRAADKLEEAQEASTVLHTLKEESKGTMVYPIAAWLYHVLQIAVNPTAEGNDPQARLKESIQTSKELLQTIEGASTWPPSFGSRDFAIANLHSVLGAQYIDHGDVEEGQAHLRRAFEMNQRFGGPSAPETLALAREVLGSEVGGSAPVTMRNKLWHDVIMGTFRNKPAKDNLGGRIDKSTVRNRPTGRNLWAYAQWTDALTTVRYAVKNRPKSEDDSPVLAGEEDG